MSKDARLPRIAHVLIHMTAQDDPVSSTVLARILGTNPVLVRRMMGDLRRAGLVQSVSGARGGWRLARALEDITLLELHDAFLLSSVFTIAIPAPVTACQVESAAVKAVSNALNTADIAFRAALAQHTLAQILTDSALSETKIE